MHAEQIVRCQAVATAKEFIVGKPHPTVNKVTVYAPVRIDLAGGWSDTPPQTYEVGGTVVTLSLKLNGEVSKQKNCCTSIIDEFNSSIHIW